MKDGLIDAVDAQLKEFARIFAQVLSLAPDDRFEEGLDLLMRDLARQIRKKRRLN